MKKNIRVEIKGLEPKALQSRAKALRQEIGDFTVDRHLNKLTNFKSIRTKRKELAVVLTVMRQKELIAEVESRLKGGSN